MTEMRSWGPMGMKEYDFLVLHADFSTLPSFSSSRSLSQQHPFSLTCIQRGNSKEPQPRFITQSIVAAGA